MIPVGDATRDEKDQIKFNARQTRLGLGTSTPTAYGELKTYIESGRTHMD